MKIYLIEQYYCCSNNYSGYNQEDSLMINKATIEEVLKLFVLNQLSLTATLLIILKGIFCNPQDK